MQDQLKELLYQALETEIGGQQVYRAAIECAGQPELKEEWQKYLEETENHERILRDVFQRLGLDPELQVPGREPIRMKGQALVKAMQTALEASGPNAAQLTAAESVVEAETKDHQNWEIMGRVAETLSGDEKTVLLEAFGQVEEQEDEHLYHTMGWARELWLQFLGMPAKIPPPEEEKKVTSGVEAARTMEKRLDEAAKPASSRSRSSSRSSASSSRSRSSSSKSSSSKSKDGGKKTASSRSKKS